LEQATVDELWKDTEALANRATFDGARRCMRVVCMCACWCDSLSLARSLTGDTRLSRDDASTWDVWPSKGMGILGGDIAAGPQAWSNRQHPRVHQVYSNLFGTEKLIASVDRYGAAASLSLRTTAHTRLNAGAIACPWTQVRDHAAHEGREAHQEEDQDR
jgi:hypothetical protein